MTTQPEDYIESRLTTYREELEDKARAWVQWEVNNVLKDQEICESDRASVDLHLRGEAYAAHMKNFMEDTKREMEKYFKAISDKNIARQIDEYRQKLKEDIADKEEREVR